jgi:choline transport protein
VSLFGANATLAIYALYHPDYNAQRWHIFIAYLGITWITCAIVLFGQRILPRIANLCAGLCMTIWFVTLMVCAIMPSTTGKGYASNKFVWREWNNQSGWSSDGFVFCAGMLNGAFAIGTPDGATHRKFVSSSLRPSRNNP